MGYYKRVFRAGLQRVGLDVRRVCDSWPVDRSRAVWSHPLEALYGIHCRDVLLNVPLRRIRFQSLHAFAADHGGKSPFIATVIDYLDGRCTTYSGSKLEEFYNACQPRTAADFMQLPIAKEAWLHNMPAIASILPWLEKTPEYALKAVSAWTEKDSREHGAQLTIRDGCQHFGPVSQEKGELEFARLVRVTKSILHNGFRVDPSGDDNIWVFLLLDGDHYVLHQEGGGNHRLAALAALDYEEVIVQVKTQYIARKQDAKWWPMVRDEYLTEQEAIAVFDRIFQGDSIDYRYA